MFSQSAAGSVIIATWLHLAESASEKKVLRNPEEENAAPVFVVTTRCRMMKACLGLRFAGLANHHLAIFQHEQKAYGGFVLYKRATFHWNCIFGCL